MTSWLAKAKSHFSQNSQEQTPKTTETPLMGVMGACSSRIHQKQGEVLGVLGVCSERIYEKRISSDPLAKALMAAAMQVCDFWNDSPAARDQMRLDIEAVPPHERAELLALFRTQYGSNKP